MGARTKVPEGVARQVRAGAHVDSMCSREVGSKHLALTQFGGVSEPGGSAGHWWLPAPENSCFGWALSAERRGSGCGEKRWGV